MIISYSNNFIFMHARKTAGSTITAALNRHIGAEDIQLGAWPDTIEAGGRFNETARRIARQNFPSVFWPSLKKSLKEGRPNWAPGAVNEAMRRHYFDKGLRGGTHSSAEDVRNYDPEIWDTAFKFGFVRNPWSHAVSDYHWRCHVRGLKSFDFKEYLLRLKDRDRPDPERIRPPLVTNWSIYTIANKIALNHVARFEDLTSELDNISKKIGIKVEIDGIKSKGRVWNKSIEIRSMYDEETIEIVRSVYREEV